ncbi:hypothetical protein MUG12_18105 [Escherichia albertii NBRC 107761 = DSM 17582]|uniref:hypothetical protein n=1 Tax=Escherichia TaxID=561 RepID=UPI000500393B|nr:MULTISPECIES: hypothetical protein [Escherichia]EHY3390272.1 hypothetical protein [Escherichia coli]EKG0288904.1 hypothetical protein [Escherichia albertii]MCJ2198624.1 hypothetical protein [Escherichia albertii NBRC 107761 = DSM 17582]MCZ8600836.1 hypothetical protein [Escherichia albertii]MCZ8798113.1 hypothetical protein [Escherichia albertii]
MNKQNGIGIVEVCVVLISSLFFIYISSYILHLSKTFNAARDVANELRLMREQIEIYNNIKGKQGYKIYESTSGYYLIMGEGEKKIDEILMICMLVKDSCGYVIGNKMKYVSFLRAGVSLADIGISLPASGTVNAALLFRI